MFWLLSWIVFGLIVGLVSKALSPKGLPTGMLSTIGVGIAGSVIGGLINWVLNFGGAYHHAGLIMSIVGGVIFCWVYRTYHSDKHIKSLTAKIDELEKR
jgi:uncharacterized membrane protein YeaQ/YmgE (transglycosylase-associated protein family)